MSDGWIAINVLVIFGYSPIVIRVFALSNQLNKLFVVGNDDQLEVTLLSSGFNDTNIVIEEQQKRIESIIGMQQFAIYSSIIVHEIDRLIDR